MTVWDAEKERVRTVKGSVVLSAVVSKLYSVPVELKVPSAKIQPRNLFNIQSRIAKPSVFCII